MLRNRTSGLPSHDGAAGYGGGSAGGSGGAGGSYGGYSTASNNGGYGGYGNDNDNKYATKRKSSSPGFSMNPTLMACIGLGCWAVIATGMNWSKGSQMKRIFKEAGKASSVEDVIDYMHSERRKAYTVRQEAKDSIRDHTDRHSTKVKTLQEQINSLQKHKEELITKHESAEAKEEKENVEWRESAYEEQVELLQARVRKDSKRIIVERYVTFVFIIMIINVTIHLHSLTYSLTHFSSLQIIAAMVPDHTRLPLRLRCRRAMDPMDRNRRLSFNLLHSISFHMRYTCLWNKSNTVSGTKILTSI
jgi:hypothetical protein